MIIPKISEDADNLTAAIQYAKAGIYVLPVREGSKHPGSVVGSKWQTQSSRDPEQLAAWFAGTNYGIALHLGRSGLLALDIDKTDLVPDWLWHTIIHKAAPYHQTRPNSGGRGHYLFLMPEGRRIGNGVGKLAGCGLDIRGANGVIIAAPTLHPEGGEYRWVTSGEVPVLPDEIGDKLSDSTESADAATDSEIATFVQNLNGGENPRLLSTWLNKFKQDAARLDSRHDGMLRVLPAALEEAAAGYFPARDAVDVLREAFIVAMTEPGHGRVVSERAADNEFHGMLAWAVGQAKAKSPKEIREKVERGLEKAKNEGFFPASTPLSGTATPGSDSDAAQGHSGANTGHLRLVAASQVSSAAPTWAWEYNGAGRIQLGTVALLGGRPGAGKSTAARWFAAGYSTGRIPGCLFNRPVGVAYIATEESPRYVIRPSLDAAGADTKQVYFINVVDDEGNPAKLISTVHEAELANTFRENGIRVVIVDPMMSTISSGADVNRNNEVRAYLEPWARIAEAIDGIVLGVVHLNKSGSTDLVAAINGSSAFGEIARSVFGFVKSRQGSRYMSQVKNSTGQEDLSLTYQITTVEVPTDNGEVAQVAKFDITGLSDLTAADAMRADAEPDIAMSGRDEVAEWLEDFLAMNGPEVRASVVLAEARSEGHSKNRVYAAAKRLKVEQVARDFPRKSYWMLPPDVLTAAIARINHGDNGSQKFSDYEGFSGDSEN